MAREMKDSGIEWIGEIPREWECIRFKNIIVFSNGGEVIDKGFWGDGNELLYTCQKIPMQSDFPSFPENKRTQKGDLLLTRNATPYIFIPPEGAIYSNVVQRVRLKANCDLRYVKEAELFGVSILTVNGDTIPSYNMEIWKNVMIPWPKEIEQQQIATCLDLFFAKIGKALERIRMSIENYETFKQALITEAVTKGVRGDRPMKDSGIAWIGEIPEDWNLIRLQFLIDRIESGTSVNAGQQAKQESEIGVLKTSCVSKNVFLPQENKAVNHDEYDRVSCPVMADTLIVSRMNTPELVGACGYVERDYPDLFLPDRLWQVHFIPGTNVKYIHYWIICRRIRNYYASLAVGTSSSMQNISQDQFYHAKCPTPPTDEQQEIVSYLDAKCAEIDALISTKQRFLAELEAYKKSVIYEYVTGKKEAPVCP